MKKVEVGFDGVENDKCQQKNCRKFGLAKAFYL
jgi:hypothetical protein